MSIYYSDNYVIMLILAKLPSTYAKTWAKYTMGKLILSDVTKFTDSWESKSGFQI